MPKVVQPPPDPVVPPEEERPPLERETVEVVRFREPPGTRLISAEDWAAAGVPDHSDIRWDQNNNWTVKREDLALNDEQYARIIRADAGFVTEQVPVA
jgi:hypothetical protein